MRELLEVLVTVKAAPVVGRKTGEAICVAGIRLNGLAPEWVRLFPIHFRDRAFTQRFKKYQIIGIEADRGSDTRPESWRPNEDTIDLGDVLGTRDGWQARREIVEPLMIESMCALQRRVPTRNGLRR